MILRNVPSLVFFLALTLTAEVVGGLLTTPGISSGWYETLVKPAWNPPAWVFGPVWTALYVAMGVAGWLVWQRRAEVGVAVPLTLFAVQLGLNVTWSALFFSLRSPGLALAELVLLWLAVAATTAVFWRVSVPAGLLFLPYLAWTGFAVLLNAAIWRLNG